MMIILSVVFSSIFKFDIENFPLYLLSGQVIFNFFNDATTSSMTSIIGSAALIKKVYVPKYLFVVSRVFSSFINLMAAFTALIFVMVAMRAELHWTVILAVFPLTMIVTFSLGMGMLLAALTVKFRDIMHLYSVFMTGLMYLTPVIYPMSILPEPVRLVVSLNPLTNIVEMFRDVMLYNAVPTFSSLLIGIIESIIILVLGMYVFYKNQDEFILNI